MALIDDTDRRIIKLALPALGSLAVEPLYVLADTAIVGRIGTAELAGLAIAATVLAIVFAGSNFLTYGTTERVARRLGADDPVGAANVGVQTMWLSLFVGVAAALLIGLGSRWWVGLFGADPSAVPHAVRYLSVSAIGIPAILITLGAQGVLRGGADYVRPMWVLLATNIANVVIEVVMVFGLGWGVTGSALSTVLAQIGGALVFVYLVRGRLQPASRWAPSWDQMAPLMTAGRYLVLRVLSMLTILTAATAIAARSGAVVVAAHSIVSSLFLLSGLVLDALAMPAQNMVAEALGQDRPQRALSVSRRVARLSLVGGVIIAVILALSAGSLGRAFSNDPAVVSTARSGLLWLAVGVVPGSIAFAYDGVLIGSADYRFIGVAAFGTTALLAPLGWYLLHTSASLGAIWAVLALWFGLRAMITWSRSERLYRARPA